MSNNRRMERVHPLRAWRKSEHKTQAEVAGVAGVVTSYISQLERFEHRQPSLTVAAKLSEMTGIPIDKFVKPREAAE